MKFQLTLKPSNQVTIAVLALGAFLVLATYQWLWKRSQPEHPASQTTLSAEFIVDINRSDWTQLAMLPGIGEALARAIVEYREQNGPFVCLEDLMAVDGIGEKKVNGIEPYVPDLPISRDRLANHPDPAGIR